jgi:two-component system, NtrC family, response regulator HydG
MDAPPTHHTAGKPASRGRVLLVEDDPEFALFCTHVLARGGRFDVTHIADPTAALALAAAQRWDLVITDLDLPLMSGFEVAAVLRRMAPGLPVVIVTAYPQDAPILTSAEHATEPDALLAKPITIDLLLATATALTA